MRLFRRASASLKTAVPAVTGRLQASGGDRLEIDDLTDVNDDSIIDLADLDAGGHSISGNTDAIVITFESGTGITLDGLNGTGIGSFADLVANAKANIDIL